LIKDIYRKKKRKHLINIVVQHIICGMLEWILVIFIDMSYEQGWYKEMNIKYIVVKFSDVNHLTTSEISQLRNLLEKIEDGRKSEGKERNTYLVINTDEPYADEIVEILKENGHWG
jgi:hypothetical protein